MLGVLSLAVGAATLLLVGVLSLVRLALSGRMICAVLAASVAAVGGKRLRRRVAEQRASVRAAAEAEVQDASFDWSRPSDVDDGLLFGQGAQDAAAARAGAASRNRVLVRFRAAGSELLAAMPRGASGRDLQTRAAEALGVPCERLRLLLDGDALAGAAWGKPLKDGPREVIINVQRRATMSDFDEIEKVSLEALVVRHARSGDLLFMALHDRAKYKSQKITSKAYTEQSILAELNHPLVLRLHHSFQTESVFAYVTDYHPEGCLSDVLKAKGAPGLPVEEAARLGRGLISALAYIHGVCVIHRDAKLENVQVDVGGRPVLGGYGFARKVSSDGRAKTMCGSYGYCAPEIMLNKGSYGLSVDLYSFGVLLYMLLSGGEKTPRGRFPPMRHPTLQRKLKDAKKEPWAEVGDSLELLLALTLTEEEGRGTAVSVQAHAFFAKFEVATGRT